MISFNSKTIYSIFVQGKAVQAVYYGTQLVWQAIRSCFGSGRWINDKPWLNIEAWRNQ